MNYEVKKLETTDARETMMVAGVEFADNVSLLHSFLQYGAESSQNETAASLLENISLDKICDFSVKEWIGVGLSEETAVAIASIVELTKRSMKVKGECGPRVMSSEELAKRLCATYGNEKQEHFVALYLDKQNHIIEERVLFIGSVDRAILDPKVVVHHAVKNLAISVIVCHNHPSGSVIPSPNDDKSTETIRDCLKIFEINFLDHIIVSKTREYYSYREQTDML